MSLVDDDKNSEEMLANNLIFSLVVALALRILYKVILNVLIGEGDSSNRTTCTLFTSRTLYVMCVFMSMIHIYKYINSQYLEV